MNENLQQFNVTADDAEETSGTSLAESIETRRFLGREFLAWLWFESEAFEQKFEMSGDDGPIILEIWLEKTITLEKLTESGKEKDVMTGVAPSGSTEAKECVRQGKWPTKAKVGIKIDERAFAFTFDAEMGGLTGVKIPALLKAEGDDPFFERMTLLEDLERYVEALYMQFLRLRLDEARWAITLAAMEAWANEEVDLSTVLAPYQDVRS